MPLFVPLLALESPAPAEAREGKQRRGRRANGWLRRGADLSRWLGRRTLRLRAVSAQAEADDVKVVLMRAISSESWLIE